MILPLIIDKELKTKILNFVDNSDEKFWTINTAGKNRKFCQLNNFNLDLTKEIKEYSKKIYNIFQITNFRQEHIFGNFIGVQTEGAFVHSHTDPNLNGLEHIRINFMISKPIGGGIPIINNEEFNIEEDQAWLNRASKYYHSSTPVKGDKKRIVLSLGSYLTKKDINKIINK
jgi:hypothetical protein